MVLADMLWNRPQTKLTLSEITSDFLRKTLFYHLLDYYTSPANGYYAIRGKWAHAAKRMVFLSPDFGQTVRERRLQLLSVNSEVSGQVDIYYLNYHRLVDYKTVSRVPDLPRPEHIRQLNAYAELLRANSYEVDDARLTYLSYSSHISVPVEVWERGRTQEMLREAIEFYSQCLEDRVVPPRDLCAGPDRWFMCKFCPFNEVCKANEGWYEIGGGNEDS